MLSLGQQEQNAIDIWAKIELDEPTKQRWDRISGFIDRMFDVSHGINSWLNPETFVDYYT